MDELSYIQHSVAEQVVGDFLDEIEKLQKENKRLLEALAFYADEHSYFRVDRYAESIVMQDEGKIARQVLKK